MYSQFQTSELYFLGCPAGRLFQNEYLKQETEKGQTESKLSQKSFRKNTFFGGKNCADEGCRRG